MFKCIISAICFVSSLTYAVSLPDPLEAGWQGQQVCVKLHEDEKQRMLRCTFPPSVGHERHFHAANVGYTIQGGIVRMVDAKGTREATIKTGDTHVNSNGTEWHEIVNIGETTIIYLVIEVK